MAGRLYPHNFCVDLPLNQSVAKRASSGHNTRTLSTREREVLLWLMRGKAGWKIGQILNISNKRTADEHVRGICRKLGRTTARKPWRWRVCIRRNRSNAYRLPCIELAEQANEEEHARALIEACKVFMKAALREEGAIALPSQSAGAD